MGIDLSKKSTVMPGSNGHVGDRAAWLQGGTSECATLPSPLKDPLRLVLLGAPGVGKGTQAELLHKWSGACHLSTGDIFRDAKTLPPSERSPAIESALGFMERGELAPDETVLALVSERLRCLRCPGGFLLDGFPRTVTQAEALEQWLEAQNLPLTGVIDYELSIDKIIERLAGRRVCANCKKVFHVTDQWASPEKCPACGGQLYQREDDHPQAIRVRMEAYHQSTEPLIKFYRQRNLVLTIPAEGTPEEIFHRTADTLALRPTRECKQHKSAT